MTTLQLRIPPKPQFARLVRERLIEFAQSRGVEFEEIEEFLTGVSEALANAILHGGSEEPVDVELRMESPSKLVVTITDHGRGFDATKLQADLPPVGSENGRGIVLMRRFADIFALHSRPGGGTEVVLGHYLRRRHSRRLRDTLGSDPHLSLI